MMKIANNTTWRTEDLKALVEFVEQRCGAPRSRRINADTILLFTVNRNRMKGRHTANDLLNHCVVELDYRTGDYDNTITIKIAPPQRLKQGILDQIATTTGAAIREISLDHMRQIVQNIGVAICGSFHSIDLSGFEGLHFRSNGRREKDQRLLSRRRIETLEREIADIHRSSQREIEKRRASIRKLQSS